MRFKIQIIADQKGSLISYIDADTLGELLDSELDFCLRYRPDNLAMLEIKESKF